LALLFDCIRGAGRLWEKLPGPFSVSGWSYSGSFDVTRKTSSSGGEEQWARLDGSEGRGRRSPQSGLLLPAVLRQDKLPAVEVQKSAEEGENQGADDDSDEAEGRQSAEKPQGHHQQG